MKTKKNKLTNFLKTGIVLFGISLLLWNCEKDEILTIEQPQNTLERKINYLTSKEVKTEILSKIQSKTGFITSGDSYKNRSSNYQYSLDLENIMQIIDTIGNTNYTFRLNVNDNDESTFYNLIVNENLQNNEPLIYVTKYVVDDNYRNEFIGSGHDFNKFTGKTYKYNIDNFLASHSSYLNRGSGVDDCPCDETEVIDGNNPIGSPGGGSTGIPTGGGSGWTSNTVCYTTYTTYSNPCDGANSGNPDDIWDQAHDGEDYTASNGQHCSGTSGPVTVATTECRTYYTSSRTANKTADDCNNPCEGVGTDGDVGVLLPLPMSTIDIAEILGFEDNSPEYIWLDTNRIQRFAISNFLNANKVNGIFAADAINFSYEALLSLKENTDTGSNNTVNYIDKVINKLTNKEKCVLQKLQQLTGTFFSDLINDTFGQGKNANVLFETDSSISNITNNAITHPFFGGGARFYRIKLSPNYINNASTLEIAETLIHELIHAELMERCIQSGLIEQLNVNPNGQVTMVFNGSPTVYSTPQAIFNQLVIQYKNSGGGNPDWQHDLFNVLGLRQKIKTNLLQQHNWLDNATNPFQNSIDNDPIVSSLQECVNAITWRGLEDTNAYNALSSSEKTKILYTQSFVKANYNQNCN